MPVQQQLVSDGQMQALRDLAKLGMVTEIVIERRSEGAIPVGGDYGDDFLAYTETSESVRTVVKGWFHTNPSPIQEVDSSMVVTVNTYRLFLPVGTDIMVGDLVHVEPSTDSYTVSDTTAEGTWLPLLTVSLRKRD